MSELIVLLKDFGLKDNYVGVMKGVMKGIAPNAEFIDLSHEVARQSIQNGALMLHNNYSYFPQGTTFLVVVDPTVGSERRPIIVDTDKYRFIAPDNGVLQYILDDAETIQAAEISNTDLRLQNQSYTFHGRDIFAPAAAYAAIGTPIAEFGNIIDDLVQLEAPEMIVRVNHIEGEITHIDTFGNCISSIGRLRWQNQDELLLEPQSITILASSVVVTSENVELNTIKHAYHEVAIGQPMIQIDSNGYLEIAVNQGSAAQMFGIVIGQKVSIAFE